MNDNYYNKIWNEPNNHGTLFWEKVDFSKSEYKYQEMVFRDYIKRLEGINSVLELGAGTGRMTKIMLDEFPDVIYYAVDIRDRIQTHQMEVTYMVLDINDKEFDEKFGVNKNEQQFDLILASEVFMHIKPEDIDNVIQKLSKIGKQIINIDWAYAPYTSEWCFIHPYHELYTKYGAKMQSIVSMEKIKQALFHYRFSD